MKTFSLLLLLALISCGPVKIKDFNDDYTQELVGSVQSITIQKHEYKFLKKDTINLVTTSFLNYDKGNKLVSEKHQTVNGSRETFFKYQEDLLIQKQIISKNDTSSIVYKYDKERNVTEEIATNKNGIYNVKTVVFDKYHNPIELHNQFKDKIKQSVFIDYDYKRKSFLSKSVLDTIATLEIVTKNDFNKRGFITKRQRIASASNAKFYSYEFDKKGNLTSKIYHKGDGTIIEIITFKNTYDKVGNIISRERYLDNKLIDKTTYHITYY